MLDYALYLRRGPSVTPLILPSPLSNTQIIGAQCGSHAAVKKHKHGFWKSPRRPNKHIHNSATLGKQPTDQSIRRVKFGTWHWLSLSQLSTLFGCSCSGCFRFLYSVEHEHVLNDKGEGWGGVGRLRWPEFWRLHIRIDPPRKRRMHDSWCKQRTPDSFDMKTLFPSRTALPPHSHSFSEFTNS